MWAIIEAVAGLSKGFQEWCLLAETGKFQPQTQRAEVNQNRTGPLNDEPSPVAPIVPRTYEPSLRGRFADLLQDFRAYIHDVDELKTSIGQARENAITCQDAADRSYAELLRFENNEMAEHLNDQVAELRDINRRDNEEATESRAALENVEERMAGRRRDRREVLVSMYRWAQDYMNDCMTHNYPELWAFGEKCCNGLRVCLDRHKLVESNQARLQNLKVDLVQHRLKARRQLRAEREGDEGKTLQNLIATRIAEVRDLESLLPLQVERLEELESQLIFECVEPLLALQGRISDANVRKWRRNGGRDRSRSPQGSGSRSSSPDQQSSSDHSDDNNNDDKTAPIPKKPARPMTRAYTKKASHSPEAEAKSPIDERKKKSPSRKDKNKLVREYQAAQILTNDEVRRLSTLDQTMREGHYLEILTYPGYSKEFFEERTGQQIERQLGTVRRREARLERCRKRLLKAKIEIPAAPAEQDKGHRSLSDIVRAYENKRKSPSLGEDEGEEMMETPSPKRRKSEKLTKWRYDVREPTPEGRMSNRSYDGQSLASIDIAESE